MVRKNVLGCDHPDCPRTDAQRWVLTPPGGKAKQIDLCPDHDGPARQLEGLGREQPRPMKETRLTRALESRVKMR